MLRRRLALWAASIAAIHTAAASAVPFHELFQRQSQQTQTSSTCAPNWNRCKNPDFPDYFCCGASTTCIALAANTTVLCCPAGSDCLRIQPVPCNLQLQDGKLNPDAVIKTTALDGKLGKCGDQCCPFGYSCVDRLCVRDRNQNAAPIGTGGGKPSATTTTTGGANPTSTGTGDPTANPTGSNSSSDNNNNSNSNSTPVAAIAGGATAAGVIIIGAAVLAFIFFRKRNKDSDGEKPNRPGGNSPPKLSRSTSSFGNLISNPIVADNSFRTDFARGPGPRTPPEDPDSVTGALIDSSVNSPEAGAGAGGAMPAVPLAAALAGHQQQQQGAYGGYGNLDPGPGLGANLGAGGRGPGGPGAGGPGGQNVYLRMPFSPSDPNDIDDEIYHGGGPAGLGGYLPQTPRQQQFPRGGPPQQGQQLQPGQQDKREREPSSVSINVFADPNITPDRTPETHADEYEDVAVRDTRVGGPGPGGPGGQGGGGNNRYTQMTSFTQMLDKADLGGMARGESFLDAYADDHDDGRGNGNGGLVPPVPRR
ncbi:hypothetical protein B0J18DRAFT_249371 [Chaetomium sp. MPI-SDFR-AT-0129]|nr:hypothetical protein B0J18DRAFT_249371 [Chaetomium sp. MPI-SDFR-AT-0129]